jgi:hypothetical protein
LIDFWIEVKTKQQKHSTTQIRTTLQ